MLNSIYKLSQHRSITEALNFLFASLWTVSIHLLHVVLIQTPLRLLAALFESIERFCEEYFIASTSWPLKFIGYIGKTLGFLLKQPLHTFANMISDTLHLLETWIVYSVYFYFKRKLKNLELSVKSFFTPTFEETRILNISTEVEMRCLEFHAGKLMIRLLVVALITGACIAATAATMGIAMSLPAIIVVAAASLNGALTSLSFAGLFIIAMQLITKFLDEIGKFINNCGKYEKNESPNPLILSTLNFYQLIGKPRHTSIEELRAECKRQLYANHHDATKEEKTAENLDKKHLPQKPARTASLKPDKQATQVNERFFYIKQAYALFENDTVKADYDRRLNQRNVQKKIMRSPSFINLLKTHHLFTPENNTENNEKILSIKHKQ